MSVGIILAAVALCALIFAVDASSEDGWGKRFSFGLIGAICGLIVGLILAGLCNVIAPSPWVEVERYAIHSDQQALVTLSLSSSDINYYTFTVQGDDSATSNQRLSIYDVDVTSSPDVQGYLVRYEKRESEQWDWFTLPFIDALNLRNDKQVLELPPDGLHVGL